MHSLVALAAFVPVAVARQYNVLYFLADDLRPEVSEGYGQKQVITPNIDKLAAGGLVFNKAYCQQAVCGPSRNSFMTGRRPHRTNVLGTGTGEDFRKSGQDVNGAGADWITMPEHFKQRNFTTLGGGKTFHPNHPKNFDYPTSWSTDMPYFDFSYWLTSEATKVAYPGPCPGHAKPNVPGLAGPIAVWCALDEPDEHFYDHGLATNTIERLRYAAKVYKEQGVPFYIQSGFARPHTPWRVPQRFWDLYKTDEIQLAKHKFPPEGMPGVAWMAHSFYNATTGDPWPLNVSQPLDDGVARLARHGYYASVSWLDHQIGRIMDELQALGLQDDTIVLLHGDHGWQLGEHNSWHKYTNFELGTRVPLIIRAPMFEASVGKRTDALAELVDVYPTLAELAGTARPRDVLDGVSLAPFFEDPSRRTIPTTSAQGTLNKTVAFSQYSHSSVNSAEAICPWYRNGSCQQSAEMSDTDKVDNWMGFSVRDERWRYTAWIPYNGTNALWSGASSPGVYQELYDHAQDPGTDFDQGDDVVNLAYESQHVGTAKAMFQLARNFFDVVAPPTPLPKKECQDFCKTKDNPWTTKCTWDKCTGCPQCPSQCLDWCGKNAAAWSKKCDWAGCSACANCTQSALV